MAELRIPPARCPAATIARRPFGMLEVEGVAVHVSHATFAQARAVRRAGDDPEALADAMLALVAGCASLADGTPLDAESLPNAAVAAIARAALEGRVPEGPEPDFRTPPAPSGTGGSASPISETPPPG